MLKLEKNVKVTASLDDIMELMLSVFPDAVIEEDNDGNLVIYPGLYPAQGDETGEMYQNWEPNEDEDENDEEE